MLFYRTDVIGSVIGCGGFQIELGGGATEVLCNHSSRNESRRAGEASTRYDRTFHPANFKERDVAMIAVQSDEFPLPVEVRNVVGTDRSEDLLISEPPIVKRDFLSIQKGSFYRSKCFRIYG